MSAEARGPVAVALDPIRRLAADLEKRALALRAALQRTRGRTDGEAIHDLRVAVRRFEAAAHVWPFLVQDRRIRRAVRTATRLRRRLSATREREVLIEHVHERIDRTVTPDLRPWLRRLEARVDRGRRRAARRVRRPRARRRLRRLSDRVVRETLALMVAPGRWESALATAHERRTARRRQAIAALETARLVPTDERLHEARIAVKKWRYAEECLATVESPASKIVAELKSLQEILGGIHDASVLRDALVAEARRLEAAGRPAGTMRGMAATVESERRERMRAFAGRSLAV